MVVTAALVVAGGASCLAVVNNNVRSPDAMSGGQSVVYKTESASEFKTNKWETAKTTAFAATRATLPSCGMPTILSSVANMRAVPVPSLTQCGKGLAEV
jgi:hypothetical protein